MKNSFRKTLKRFLRITVFPKPRLKGSLPLEHYLLSRINWRRYCDLILALPDPEETEVNQ